MPSSACGAAWLVKTDIFGGTYLFHLQGSVGEFSTLKMKAIRSPEMSFTLPTRRHIPEDDILQRFA
jgi:hypothetical protein